MSLRRPETAAKGVELDYLVPSTVYRLRVPSILCFCPFFYVHFVFSTAIFCRILSPFMYVLRFVPTSAFCPVFLSFYLRSRFTLFPILSFVFIIYLLPYNVYVCVVFYTVCIYFLPPSTSTFSILIHLLFGCFLFAAVLCCHSVFSGQERTRMNLRRKEMSYRSENSRFCSSRYFNYK